MMRATVLAALAITSCSTASGASTGQRFEAKARSLDGDTLAIDFRLLGVDAFERGQRCERASGCWHCGKAAQEFAANALRSGTATVRLTSSATYGRPVAIVSVNGKDLGERLILAGLAVPQPQYLRGDPRLALRYAAAYRRATASRAGAFASRWITPARWRHGDRLRCER